MFQIRLGRKIRNAIAPPARIHGVNSSFLLLVNSNPASKADAKMMNEYFVCSPTPAITPKTIHSFGFPVLIKRSTTNARPPQSSGSKPFIANW